MWGELLSSPLSSPSLSPRQAGPSWATMASQGQHRGPPACPACSRADPTRHFFCRTCISSWSVPLRPLSPCGRADPVLTNSLADHNARRQQLRNALTLVTAKANALLSGADRAPSSSRAPPLGVTDERLLKADKWILASRAYAAREAVVKAKQANSQGAPLLLRPHDPLSQRS